MMKNQNKSAISYQKHGEKMNKMNIRYAWYAKYIEPQRLIETKDIRDTVWMDVLECY